MIQKQTLSINFAAGIDTKTDQWQIAPNNFLVLQNQVFTVGQRLTKRNGYGALTLLPNTSSTYLTTLNNNLTAIGDSIYALNSSSETWVSKGTIQPMKIDTLPLIRNNLNQIQVDAAVANGLVCTVYSEKNNATVTYKYAIANNITGQNIIAPTLIPVSSGTVTGSPRVFVLGNFFVIVFTNVITATSHLQYIAVSLTNPATVTTNQDIASAYTSSTTLSWDGVVAGVNLYIAYNTVSGGQAVKVTYLSAATAAAGGTPVAAKTFATYKATLMSLSADTTGISPIIWVNFYRSDTSLGFVLAVDSNLNTVLAPTATILTGTVLNLASAAQNQVCSLFFEVSNAYSYDATVATNFIDSYTITQAGVVSSLSVIVRGVGLASKAFIVDGVIFFLSAYQNVVGTPYQNNGNYQPTYFLINGSTSLSSLPVVVGKLAYGNGGGYLTLGLPSVTVLNGNQCWVGYLFKDLIAAVNKGTAVASGTQTAGIYSQTGITLGTLTIGTQNIDTAEIGNDLLISGGFLQMYDGYLPVEQNFLLWPDNVEAAGSGTAGSMSAQQYFYQATYEWTDNQGNAYRSAPSIPVTVTLTSDTSVDLNIPMLRLTSKVANPVKIVIYRWSAAQQIYYQVTSLTAPLLNDTTVDSVAYNDGLADATILGNNILYTNGGVIENTSAPGTNIMTLFDTRLWMVDAEDQNLLWYSKQVIEAVPVEMSDLLTLFISPSQAAQGNTGVIGALAPMDDKLVIWKTGGAIYYINGTGPDNTGSNNQYSQPIFITSAVGCHNQASVVLQPNGLMFQANQGRGIWILGRDLSTNYIGAPVEAFNGSAVTSAVNVPNSTQVRFTLNTGQTLMFDYYYNQWATFVGAPAISSCIYNGLHTLLNSFGAVYQETPGIYVDGANPVLIGLTTAWFDLAGLQGYQRAFFFYLLAQYYSPHKLQVGIAYDYNPSPEQGTLITPTNFGSVYGGPTPNPGDGTDSQSPLGQTAYLGGTQDGALEQWRIFLTRQRCQSFQIQIQEVYDASFGGMPGQGLSLSGINLVYGVKKGFKPMPARLSAGGGTA